MKNKKKFKKFKKVFSPATTTILLTTSLMLNLWAIMPPLAQAKEAECNSEWIQQSLDWIIARLGYTPAFYFCYEIDAGAVESTYIMFDANDVKMGKDHLMIAECDNDCSDIDLRVYDEKGRLIGEDNTSNTYAEVRINNISDGETFLVELEMYACQTEFCGAVLATTPVE
jgi:hypothetical protein